MIDIAMVAMLSRVLLLAYTRREKTVWVVSFRIAHRNERKAYEAACREQKRRGEGKAHD